LGGNEYLARLLRGAVGLELCHRGVDISGGERLGEQEALGLGAALLADEFQLRLGLDALGRGRRAETLADASCRVVAENALHSGELRVESLFE
jgi:hypothetical protein